MKALMKILFEFLSSINAEYMQLLLGDIVCHVGAAEGFAVASASTCSQP